MIPVRDKNFRPMLLYSVLAGWPAACHPVPGGVPDAGAGAQPHLPDHGGRGVGAAAMAGGWYWGRCADRTNWRHVIRITAAVNLSCTLGWSLLQPQWARWAAPVLLVVSAACAGGANNASVNLQYACSPPSGKTAYIGVTAAMASFAACLSAALGTALQPGLEAVLGPDSIRVMFCGGRAGRLCQPDRQRRAAAQSTVKAQPLPHYVLTERGTFHVPLSRQHPPHRGADRRPAGPHDHRRKDHADRPVLQQRFLHGGQKRPRDRDRL